ncbi:uncharacterized protein C18orf63-like isoform X2 [Xenia sp. Carnegie-2017]|uniref:uncharacterized protein C18orf63-like isoform X2 n=1 Tax=Xenia sp. Carnegie-2017 TaxID=2897299 RepID=UPI001F03FA15|nr:uncharacterized protein C18orf63-like isoform X2 [Xenia sp. Carnegie-2017]
MPMTKSLFLYCFQFVLTHRLAPLWNKIDSHFLKGRDFLVVQDKMFAIEADISLTDKITLALKAHLLKLPVTKVNDFGVSPNMLQLFNQCKNYVIQGYSLENNRCFVLPSLKTAYITSISHHQFGEIDLKQYWKVVYGIRLPATNESNAIFYNIRFPTSEKIFSYPQWCVRHMLPQASSRCEQKCIYQSFLEDIMTRMPSLCGSPLSFTCASLYPSMILHNASVSRQTNLTKVHKVDIANKPLVHSKKRTSTSGWTKAEVIVSSQQKARLITTVKKTEEINQTASSVWTNSLHPVNTNYVHSSNNTEVRKPFIPVFNRQKCKSRIISRKEACNKGNNCLTKAKPIVPCFTNTSSHKGKDIFAINAIRPTAKMVNDESRDAKEFDPLYSNDLDSMRLNPLVSSNTVHEKSEDVSLTPLRKVKTAKVKKKNMNEDLDVRKIVAENKLSKVNVPTLVRWLKLQGVKCKCKEKKQDLIAKVYQHLDLVRP